MFTNGYGDHRKTPGLVVRSFDVICWVILVVSYFPSIGLSFPICEMQSLAWKPMKGSPKMIVNDSSCIWVTLESRKKEGN